MLHRSERLAEAMREELCDIISGELQDPRVGLAIITEVKLPPDLRIAQVFVSVAGDETEQHASLQGLMAAKGFIRSQLAVRLQLRRLPDLRFELDRSRELGQRLDTLLTRSAKRSRPRNLRKSESST